MSMPITEMTNDGDLVLYNESTFFNFNKPVTSELNAKHESHIVNKIMGDLLKDINKYFADNLEDVIKSNKKFDKLNNSDIINNIKKYGTSDKNLGMLRGSDII